MSIRPLQIRKSTFDWTRVYVMGIVNVTPDSFYDGGRYVEPAAAIEHGLQLAEEGADLLDVGGESTRPKGPYGHGAEPLSTRQELARVLPVIEGIRHHSVVPISIDTYKSEVARAALQAGADVINDVSGLQMDPAMPAAAAEFASPIIVNHMKGTPQNMQVNPEYADLIGELSIFFKEKIRTLEAASVSRDRILLDPGLGFGKKYADNLRLIHNIRRFAALGCPVLIGPSRKSFVGHFAGDLPPAERLEATIAAVVLCALSGANLVRVHDVMACARALKLTDAFLKCHNPVETV